MTYLLLVTHVNYYTHRELANGEVQILDLDEGIYFRIMNVMTFGTYFHRTHHVIPQVNNPQIEHMKRTQQHLVMT